MWWEKAFIIDRYGRFISIIRSKIFVVSRVRLWDAFYENWHFTSIDSGEHFFSYWKYQLVLLSSHHQRTLGTYCVREPKKNILFMVDDLSSIFPSNQAHHTRSLVPQKQIKWCCSSSFLVQQQYVMRTHDNVTLDYSLDMAIPFHSIFQAKNIEHSNTKTRTHTRRVRVSFTCNTWHIYVWIGRKKTERKSKKMNPS